MRVRLHGGLPSYVEGARTSTRTTSPPTMLSSRADHLPALGVGYRPGSWSKSLAPPTPGRGSLPTPIENLLGCLLASSPRVSSGEPLKGCGSPRSLAWQCGPCLVPGPYPSPCASLLLGTLPYATLPSLKGAPRFPGTLAAFVPSWAPSAAFCSQQSLTG